MSGFLPSTFVSTCTTERNIRLLAPSATFESFDGLKISPASTSSRPTSPRLTGSSIHSGRKAQRTTGPGRRYHSVVQASTHVQLDWRHAKIAAILLWAGRPLPSFDIVFLGCADQLRGATKLNIPTLHTSIHPYINKHTERHPTYVPCLLLSATTHQLDNNTACRSCKSRDCAYRLLFSSFPLGCNPSAAACSSYRRLSLVS